MVAGFIGHDLSEPAVLDMVVGAERHFREHGYAMILANCVGSEALAADSIRALRRRRVDGVVLALSGDAQRAMLEQFRDLAEPSVAVGGLLSARGSRSVVRIDRAAGLRAAVARLVGLGHRTIGLIGRPEDIQLLEDGVSWPPTVLVQPVTVGDAGDATAAEARIAVRDLLDVSPEVSAIIVGPGRFVPGVLDELRSAGLGVPDAVSVVTFGDAPLADLGQTRLAVISGQPLLVGETAAELLLRLLRGETGESMTVPWIFDAGETCAAARHRTCRNSPEDTARPA